MRVTICHMLDNSSSTLGNKHGDAYNEFPLQGRPRWEKADGPCSGSVNTSLSLCACTMVNRPRAFWGNLFVSARGDWQGQWKSIGHVFHLNPHDAAEAGRARSILVLSWTLNMKVKVSGDPITKWIIYLLSSRFWSNQLAGQSDNGVRLNLSRWCQC